MANKLTRKQGVFVAEYLTDFNATRAAIAAGYSEKGAEQTGSVLLRNPKVAEQIEKQTDKRLKKLEISADDLMERLGVHVDYDPIDLYEDDGSVKRLKDIPPAVRKVITHFKSTELFDGATGEQKHVIGILREIKTTDRIRAMELLGKHRRLKAWTERIEAEVNTTQLSDDERLAKLEALLNTARKRMDAAKK